MRFPRQVDDLGSHIVWNAIQTRLAAIDGWVSASMPVCTENLNTGVAVMKSAQDGA
jgi:hypothetical protein